jgi:hypothetical protein
MKSYEYIEKVKKIKNIETDYKVAKLLGWKPHKIYQYREGQSMDNDAARQIAEIINVPVMKVIADMEVQRFNKMNKPEQAKLWEKFAKQAGRATANLLIPLGFMSSATAMFCILC